FGIGPWPLLRIARTAQHQVLYRSAFPLAAVAGGTLLRENVGAFLGGSLAWRKFLAFRSDDHVETFDFVLAQRRAEARIGSLAKGGHCHQRERNAKFLDVSINQTLHRTRSRLWRCARVESH